MILSQNADVTRSSSHTIHIERNDNKRQRLDANDDDAESSQTDNEDDKPPGEDEEEAAKKRDQVRHMFNILFSDLPN